MLQSNEIGELSAALVKAQPSLKAAPFNKTNPHFKNKYADLPAVIEAIRKPLAENGLAVTQTTEVRNGTFLLVTTMRHTSGQWISSEYLLPQASRPQELGSALTYARRYSLSAIACIAADEDDDAEGARKDNQVAEMPKRDNPHVTQARDVNEYTPRYGTSGEPIDCIPVHLHRAQKLKVADARPLAETLIAAMRLSKTAADLTEFGEEHAEEFASLPDKWIDMYQGEYQNLLDELRRKQKRAA